MQDKERRAEKLDAARLAGQGTGKNDGPGARCPGQQPLTSCVTPGPHGHLQMGTSFDFSLHLRLVAGSDVPNHLLGLGSPQCTRLSSSDL